MSRYTRPRCPGASLFFTVALADRGAQTLVEHVEVLRGAVRVTKAERPFRIEAMGRAAGPHALRLDTARGGRGLFRAHGRHQSAIYRRIA